MIRSPSAGSVHGLGSVLQGFQVSGSETKVVAQVTMDKCHTTQLDAAAAIASRQQTFRARAEADVHAQRLQPVTEGAQDPDQPVGAEVRLAGDQYGLRCPQLVQHLPDRAKGVQQRHHNEA